MTLLNTKQQQIIQYVHMWEAVPCEAQTLLPHEKGNIQSAENQISKTIFLLSYTASQEQDHI